MSDSQAHLETTMKEFLVTPDGLGLEPMPDSLWWTSTSAQERKHDMDLVAMDMSFTPPLMDSFVILGHAFERSSKGIPSLDVRVAKRYKKFASRRRTSTEASQ